MKIWVLLLLSIGTINAQTLYWDSNDTTPGAGDTPNGTWDSDAFWTTDPTGGSATTTWTDGNTAVFSAGTDATNAFTVTILGAPTVTGITVEEGSVTNTGGTIILSGVSGVAEIKVASGASNTISSIVTGDVKIQKTGSGTLTLGTVNSQANTFTGGVVVATGILSFPGEGNSAVVGTSNPLGINPATFQANHIIISNNATLRSTKAGAGSSFAFANRGITLGTGGGVLEATASATTDYLIDSAKITGSGSLTKAGAGTLYLQSAANDYAGDTTNKAGYLGIGTTYPWSKGKLVLAGGGITAFATSPVITNNVTMTGSATFRATSLLTSGTRALIFSNIWSTTGGTLTIRNFGTAGSIFSPRFFVGGWTMTRPVVIGNAADTGTARLDFYNETNTADLTFSGVISGPGGIRRTSNNDGTGGNVILSGANTYSGGTSNNGGFIGFGSSSLPAGATGAAVTNGPIGIGNLTINDDSQIGFFAAGSSRIVGNDIVFGTVKTNTYNGTNDLEFTGAATLNANDLIFVVNNTGLTKFSGAISAGGSTLTKKGNGTLVFGAPNTYNNNTVVQAGGLFVNNITGSGTSTGTVIVNSGATLGGSGIISGPVTCSGNIAPGNSAGTLTLGGDLDLSSDGTYVWELAANSVSPGSADQIALTVGNLTLGGTSKLSINFTNAATAPNSSVPFWQSSHTWTIVALSGSASNPGSSNFGSLLNATSAAGTFTAANNGNGGIDLTFTPSAQPPVFSGTITGAGTANVGLSWSAINGTTYQVQYKDDLNAAIWSVLGNVTAVGSSASTNDTTGPVAQRFYRLVVQ